LGKIVFGNPQALRRLESIVHPAVRERLALMLQETTAEFVFIEAIKLLEGPLRQLCDQIWVTTCSRDRQLERLRVCRGLDAATAVSRVEAQSPQAEKVTQADVLIDTDGLMRDTEQQFERAWLQLVDMGQSQD
jgi:dephospho-CoA kinase